MSKIKLLLPHEAQKIAAGEVVERPANIVKELIENALDADATAITIYIEDGGKQLIRVVDNGCGMDAEDAQLCFAKHATSKISSVDQLESINTFGFRGEALASITAVAKVTLITKQAKTTEGIKLELQENTIVDESIVPAPVGTDIAVRELFYSIPARKKFLKKKETEWRHIQQLVQACSLAYPSVHFKLISENNTTLACPSVTTLSDRFTQLWDHTTAQQLLPINEENKAKQLTITGVISNHQVARYDRNGIFFFVNNRWIKDQLLARALVKGYANVLPPGRYPMACIKITIDPTLVDINIHPRKEEVRFMRPNVAQTMLKNLVTQTLEQHISKQITKPYTPFDFDAFKKPPIQTFGTSTVQDSSSAATNKKGAHDTISSNTPSLTKTSSIFVPNTNQTSDTHTHSPEYTATEANKNTLQELMSKPHNKQNLQDNLDSHVTTTADQTSSQSGDTPSNVLHSADAMSTSDSAEQIHLAPHKEQESPFTIIGQLNKCYILLEQQDGLFVVDQHAAHERVLYELFATRFDQAATVQLLFPQIITVHKDDVPLVEEYKTLFTDNGIVLDCFGDNQLIINATPVHVKDVALDELVYQVIGWIKEYSSLDKKEFLKTINEKLHAQMACKAAVKAGDTLTQEQMQQLLVDLHKTPNRFSCPHGRPTGWLLSTYDIEKKFKRIN